MFIYKPNKITLTLSDSARIGYNWVRVGGFKLNLFRPGEVVNILLRKGKFNDDKLEATIDIRGLDGVTRRGIWAEDPDGPYSRNHMSHTRLGGKLQFSMIFVKDNDNWYIELEFPLISEGFKAGKIVKLIGDKPKWVLKQWFPCKYRKNVYNMKVR